MGFLENFKKARAEEKEQKLGKQLIKQLSKDTEKFNLLAKQSHETRVKAALVIIGIYETTIEEEVVTPEMLPELSDADLDEIIDYGVEQLRRLR